MKSRVVRDMEHISAYYCAWPAAQQRRCAKSRPGIVQSRNSNSLAKSGNFNASKTSCLASSSSLAFLSLAVKEESLFCCKRRFAFRIFLSLVEYCARYCFQFLSGCIRHSLITHISRPHCSVALRPRLWDSLILLPLWWSGIPGGKAGSKSVRSTLYTKGSHWFRLESLLASLPGHKWRLHPLPYR